MTADRPTEYFIGLVHELRKLPSETEWVEFKHNRAEPEEIGEYLSALANSAALLGKINAYAAWESITQPMISWEPHSILRQRRWETRNWKTGCCGC